MKYGNRITEILAKLNPVEKDIYIKKISEETGIKEQALYDLLKSKINGFYKNNRIMNNEEEYGTKLYIEPANIKSIRNLFYLMLKEENYDFIKERFSKEDCIDEIYKGLYTLIEEVILEKGFNDIYKNIELRCESADFIKELLKIRELEDLGANLDLENLIRDYIFIIKTHKLKKEQEFVMKKLKDSERLGDIEASLSYLKQSKEIQNKLRSLKK